MSTDSTPAPQPLPQTDSPPLPTPTGLDHADTHTFDNSEPLAVAAATPATITQLRGAASASASPAPGQKHDERTVAKPGTPVAGSGDGTAYGDECFLWTDLPMNKNGYRYVACTPSPNVSPNPLYPFNRTLPGPPPSPPVHISWLDRSAFLRMSPDGLTVTTDRGYRSGRACVSVREGTWYYEAVIERGDGAGGAGKGTGGDSGNAHVRIGWGRREAGLDAPVGADAYSYGLRDVGGDKLHISRPKAYGHKPFKTGDVVGCLIHLPDRGPQPENEDEPGYVRRWRIPIRYKGQLYFEQDEYLAAKEMEALVNREGKPPAPPVVDEPEPAKKVPKRKGQSDAPSTKSKPRPPVARELKTLPGSYVSFFLNGEPLAAEPAFTDIYDFLPLPPLHAERHAKRHHSLHSAEREQVIYHDDGSLGYFPMISCFGRGKVKANFGPTWHAPPTLPDGVVARPMSERWDEWRAEEVQYDERDEAALTERFTHEMEAAEIAKAAAEAKAKARALASTPDGKSATPPTTSRRPAKKRKKYAAEGTATPTPDVASAGTATREGTPARVERGERGERTPGVVDMSGMGSGLGSGLGSDLGGAGVGMGMADVSSMGAAGAGMGVIDRSTPAATPGATPTPATPVVVSSGSTPGIATTAAADAASWTHTPDTIEVVKQDIDAVSGGPCGGPNGVSTEAGPQAGATDVKMEQGGW